MILQLSYIMKNKSEGTEQQTYIFLAIDLLLTWLWWTVLSSGSLQNYSVYFAIQVYHWDLQSGPGYIIRMILDKHHDDNETLHQHYHDFI